MKTNSDIFSELKNQFIGTMIANIFQGITIFLTFFFANKQMDVAAWVSLSMTVISFFILIFFVLKGISKTSMTISNKYIVKATDILNILYREKSGGLMAFKIKDEMKDKISENELDVILTHLCTKELILAENAKIDGDEVNLPLYKLSFKGLLLQEKQINKP